MSFYKLLKKDAVIETTEEHVKALEVIKKDLMEATNVTLRLPKPGLQYVILCDASYHGAGFVLMVEDYVNETGKKEKKKYAPVSFGSHLFNATQLKFSIYYKEFLALYYALDYFSHYIWGSSKQVIILIDNKGLTQFFQSKVIPPSLWNCLDRILAFNIVIAPDVELNVLLDTEINDDELNGEALNVLKKIGLYQEYKKRQSNLPVTENQGLFKLKRKTEINSIVYPNPLDEFPDHTDNLNSLNLAEEQQKDTDIRTVISWIQQHNQQPDLKYASNNLKKYHKHLNRLILEGNVLYRNFYEDTGKVLHKQFCVPKRLWKETIYRLHNSQTAGHLGIKATIQEFRKRFYYPGFTEHFISFIKNCLNCLQLNRVPKSQITPKLQPDSSLQSYPGDMLQIDLLGPLKSSHYKYVLSGIDVFTKYLFAVPLTNGYADTVVRKLVKVFFQHSYIPQTILSDLGTNFTSELMSELASLLEVKLKHASLKHPQTNGAVERSHGPLKRILKLNTEEQWKDWHKYVPLATIIHNTSYHSATSCCPSTLFHGREPIKPLDIRFSRKVMDAVAVNSDSVNELQDAMMQKFGENKEKLTTAYLKYKKYYDQKASAKPIPEKSFCLLLNPKLLEQSTVIASQVQKWLQVYKVEKALTDSNYIIRKVNTNYTQCVHRIRLKPIKPSETPEDLDVINPTNFQPDLSRRQHMETDLFDKHILELINEQEKEIHQSKQ